jgi:hypothetical protein
MTETQGYRGLFADHPSEFKHGNKIRYQAKRQLKDIDAFTITHKGTRFDNMPLYQNGAGIFMLLLEPGADDDKSVIFTSLTKVIGGYVRSNQDVLYLIKYYANTSLDSHERELGDCRTLDPTTIFIRKDVPPWEATALAEQFNNAIYIEVDTNTDVLDAEPKSYVGQTRACFLSHLDFFRYRHVWLRSNSSWYSFQVSLTLLKLL